MENLIVPRYVTSLPPALHGYVLHHVRISKLGLYNYLKFTNYTTNIQKYVWDPMKVWEYSFRLIKDVKVEHLMMMIYTIF